MPEKTYPKKILFIGNSYTYVNKLWDVIAALAEAEGHPVSVASVTEGGKTLKYFNDPAGEKGKEARAAIAAGGFDTVVLQEQSLRPAISPSLFLAAASSLCKQIRAAGAEPAFYATWGRREGAPALARYRLTNETMTKKLNAAYLKAGAENGARVACVGLAFYEIHTGCPEIELYQDDGSHPSGAGTFLAALTLYRVLFGESPQNGAAAAAESGVSPAAYERLLAAAENAAAKDPLAEKNSEREEKR
ncbi:MAG: SGNH/GDSL hydrolase family protein [Clostridia bacterium]|nr:SGNH/GDSL hydrolase family protein [Clostridia bacterium]